MWNINNAMAGADTRPWVQAFEMVAKPVMEKRRCQNNKRLPLNSIKEDKTIYFNSTLEFIASNPNSDYFEILTNFYAENIQNKLTRCDECFFELKLFCEAISKFKNDESKSILNNLIASEKYFTSCNYLAKNEQFYKLLTSSDTVFYKQLIKTLEPKLNNKILTEVEKYGK